MVKSLHAGLADLLQRVLGELDDLLHCLCRGLEMLGKNCEKMHCLTHAKTLGLKGCLFRGLEIQISSAGCFLHNPLPFCHWLYIPACLSDLPQTGLKWSRYQAER